MIRLDLLDWPPLGSNRAAEPDSGASLIDGAPASLPLGSFRVEPGPFAATSLAQHPAVGADPMTITAQRAIDLMQTSTVAGRGLDDLATSVIEAPEWREGLARFDKGLAELKQRHLLSFKDREQGDAFSREFDELAALRRIDLKSALARKQQDEALTGLDDALSYYAHQAATARHDAFREIAIERGLSAIDRMQAAGYLFPETAKALAAAFHNRIDTADVEVITAADPSQALKALDAGLFSRLDSDSRARLRDQAIAGIARTDTAPPMGVETEYRDEGPAAAANPVARTAAAENASPADRPSAQAAEPEPAKADEAANSQGKIQLEEVVGHEAGWFFQISGDGRLIRLPDEPPGAFERTFKAGLKKYPRDAAELLEGLGAISKSDRLVGWSRTLAGVGNMSPDHKRQVESPEDIRDVSSFFTWLGEAAGELLAEKAPEAVGAAAGFVVRRRPDVGVKAARTATGFVSDYAELYRGLKSELPQADRATLASVSVGTAAALAVVSDRLEKWADKSERADKRGKHSPIAIELRSALREALAGALKESIKQGAQQGTAFYENKPPTFEGLVEAGKAVAEEVRESLEGFAVDRNADRLKDAAKIILDRITKPSTHRGSRGR